MAASTVALVLVAAGLHAWWTALIKIDGVETVTLKELLIPGLRAVFVGINPSPISFAAGHYYQGRWGRRFWGRLQSAAIATELSMGREDDAALDQGLGFAAGVALPLPPPPPPPPPLFFSHFPSPFNPIPPLFHSLYYSCPRFESFGAADPSPTEPETSTAPTAPRA